MKKMFIVLLLCTIIALNLVPRASADQKVDVYDQQKQLVKSIVFTIGVNEYFVNGQTPGVKMDAAPFIENDRTYVPIRFLGNALGITNENITWDDSQGCATLVAGSTKAEMTIGKKEIVTNGQVKVIDVAPQLRPPGRTFLPARFVCEALGFEVDWQDDKHVVVWPKGQPKPDVANVKQYVKQLDNYTEARGYTIPKQTQLSVELPDLNKDVIGIPSYCELSILVGIHLPLEPQYQDVYKIMSSKFGDSVAKEIVDYVKLKKNRSDDLPNKWLTINNQKICVGAKKGYFDISILVWEPGHGI